VDAGNHNLGRSAAKLPGNVGNFTLRKYLSLVFTEGWESRYVDI